MMSSSSPWWRPDWKPNLCVQCGRCHLVSSLVRDPDRPDVFLCPVESRGVMRLTPAERTESERLFRSVFGGES
jgi:hypothetical protein